VTSTFDDGAAACTTTQRQSYGPFLFQHADSGNWQKLTNAKSRATSTPRLKSVSVLV
jgi:hypothetical protein